MHNGKSSKFHFTLFIFVIFELVSVLLLPPLSLYRGQFAIVQQYLFIWSAIYWKCFYIRLLAHEYSIDALSHELRSNTSPGELSALIWFWLIVCFSSEWKIFFNRIFTIASKTHNFHSEKKTEQNSMWNTRTTLCCFDVVVWPPILNGKWCGSWHFATRGLRTLNCFPFLSLPFQMTFFSFISKFADQWILRIYSNELWELGNKCTENPIHTMFFSSLQWTILVFSTVDRFNVCVDSMWIS